MIKKIIPFTVIILSLTSCSESSQSILENLRSEVKDNPIFIDYFNKELTTEYSNKAINELYNSYRSNCEIINSDAYQRFVYFSNLVELFSLSLPKYAADIELAYDTDQLDIYSKDFPEYIIFFSEPSVETRRNIKKLMGSVVKSYKSETEKLKNELSSRNKNNAELNLFITCLQIDNIIGVWGGDTKLKETAERMSQSIARKNINQVQRQMQNLIDNI